MVASTVSSSRSWTAWLQIPDDVLRGRGERVSLKVLLGLLVVFGLAYGAAMGAFSGLWGGRIVQMLYSAVKVPLLLMTCFVVALPSFFVLNTIAGVRDDFGKVLRALAASQAALTTVLVALAPLTLWFYAGNSQYESAVLWNGLMFLIATAAGQYVLRREYRPLVALDPRHRPLMWFWGITYAFVGIQAAWVLRPFIGDPSQPVQFFREGAWGNAYLELIRLVGEATGLGGGPSGL